MLKDTRIAATAILVLLLSFLAVALTASAPPAGSDAPPEVVTFYDNPLTVLPSDRAEHPERATAVGPKECRPNNPVCEPPSQQVQYMCWNDKKGEYQPCGCGCQLYL